MKTKLIKALKVAINALEKDTVEYDWYEQCSCNCGVVAQAILGKTKYEIDRDLDKASSKRWDQDKDGAMTWKNMVKRYCDITGKSTSQIFKDLTENGMTVEDITHLEYLENKAILKRADIRVLFHKNYYKKKKNLIKYLKAWVNILEEQEKPSLEKLNKNELQEELLKAVGKEEYERAANIRDLIATI